MKAREPRILLTSPGLTEPSSSAAPCVINHTRRLTRGVASLAHKSSGPPLHNGPGLSGRPARCAAAGPLRTRHLRTRHLRTRPLCGDRAYISAPGPFAPSPFAPGLSSTGAGAGETGVVVVFCESCCGLPSFWCRMNRTRSSTCVYVGRWCARQLAHRGTEAPRRRRQPARQGLAMAAGSRKRQFGLLKPRAAPCRACSASSRSLGRPAPPSPSPATSSGWLNLEWPGGLLGVECNLRVRAATGEGRAIQRACDSRLAPSW